MKFVQGDITKIKNGVICHQVNCKNKIGAGVSGAITSKWPKVKKMYHDIVAETGSQIFGQVQLCYIDPNITVANIFSQYNYGNSKKTGIVYTDMDKLVNGLREICSLLPNRNIYIPQYIGCGLAGGDWNVLLQRLTDDELINSKITIVCKK